MSLIPQKSTLRTIVVDDEPLARSNLLVLLGSDPEIEVVGECDSGTDAIAQIRLEKPDLVFLDVQMPECDGFDVIEMLGRDVPPAVVFVTAYDRYALQAFEAGALDYLLKPFDDSRFHRTMSRIKERFAAEKNRFWKPDRLAIKNAGEIIFLNLTEIDWIEAADYYAAIHVGSKTHLLRRTLAELEQELDPAVFCRIHRSAIVNLERVQALGTGLDGEYTVILKTGTTLRLSRRYRRLIQTSLAPRSLGL